MVYWFDGEDRIVKADADWQRGGMTPEQFGQAIRADLPRFAKVVKETGAKVD